jgi:hypothetical protein
MVAEPIGATVDHCHHRVFHIVSFLESEAKLVLRPAAKAWH